jgi:hypothetical protein
MDFSCQSCQQRFSVSHLRALPSSLEVECGFCGAFFGLEHPESRPEVLHKPERRIALLGGGTVDLMLRLSKTMLEWGLWLESEQQRYVFTSLSLGAGAPFALLSSEARCFDAVIYFAGRSPEELSWLRWLDGTPFMVLLPRGETSEKTEAREIELRRQIEAAGVSANDAPILRMNVDQPEVLERLDAMLMGPSWMAPLIRWGEPISRERGYEEYIASIVVGEDDEDPEPKFFAGAVIAASNQTRTPLTRSFSAELYACTEDAAEGVRQDLSAGLKIAAVLYLYVPWSDEEGGDWLASSQLKGEALRVFALLSVESTRNPMLFSALIRVGAPLRVYPGMRFFLSREDSSGRVFALGRVVGR